MRSDAKNESVKEVQRKRRKKRKERISNIANHEALPSILVPSQLAL